jgi:hypothetical protein
LGEIAPFARGGRTGSKLILPGTPPDFQHQFAILGKTSVITGGFGCARESSSAVTRGRDDNFFVKLGSQYERFLTPRLLSAIVIANISSLFS